MPADDLLPGLAAEMFEADRASSDLGIELLELGDGTATVRMTIGRSMINGDGIAHGGYLFQDSGRFRKLIAQASQCARHQRHLQCGVLTAAG